MSSGGFPPKTDVVCDATVDAKGDWDAENAPKGKDFVLEKLEKPLMVPPEMGAIAAG